jgi:DNA-binding ferritin-like protein (Dps family)
MRGAGSGVSKAHGDNNIREHQNTFYTNYIMGDDGVLKKLGRTNKKRFMLSDNITRQKELHNMTENQMRTDISNIEPNTSPNIPFDERLLELYNKLIIYEKNNKEIFKKIDEYTIDIHKTYNNIFEIVMKFTNYTEKFTTKIQVNVYEIFEKGVIEYKKITDSLKELDEKIKNFKIFEDELKNNLIEFQEYYEQFLPQQKPIKPFEKSTSIQAVNKLKDKLIDTPEEIKKDKDGNDNLCPLSL